MQHPEYRFCPACGGTLETRRLKAAEPDRLVCTSCGFVFYMDPKVAVGTDHPHERRAPGSGAPRHRAGLRAVGVSGRLRGPRRGDHRSRAQGGEGGVGPRREDRRLDQHLLVRGRSVRSSSSMPRPRSAASCAATTSAWRRACSHRTRSRGARLRSAARTMRCATISEMNGTARN